MVNAELGTTWRKKKLKFCFHTKNIVVHGWVGGIAFLRTADHKLFFISCNEVVEEEAF